MAKKSTPVAPPSGGFPLVELATGNCARRAGWAEGYEVTIEPARKGARAHMLVLIGGATGHKEWAPENLIDEMLAGDWEVLPSLADRRDEAEAAAAAKARTDAEAAAEAEAQALADAEAATEAQAKADAEAAGAAAGV